MRFHIQARTVLGSLIVAAALSGCTMSDRGELRPSPDLPLLTASSAFPEWGETHAVPYQGPIVDVDGCLYYQGTTDDPDAIVQVVLFPDGSEGVSTEDGTVGVALPDGTFIALGAEYDLDVAYSARIQQFGIDPATTTCPVDEPDRPILGLLVQGASPVGG